MLNIYYCVAAIAYGIFILQFIISSFAGDIDLDIDLDGETDFDVSDVVSFKGLIHFLMGCFGWLALKQYQNNTVTYSDYIIGFLIGVSFVVVLYFVYKLTKKFQHSPELPKHGDLVGKSGTVYVVTDKGAHIHVNINGEKLLIYCINRSNLTLNAGDSVTILDTDGANYYI